MTMWPMLLDFKKDEAMRMLRELELNSYANVVSTFRAQGDLTPEKRKVLKELQDMMGISIERHQAEIRRVTNDEKLVTMAHFMWGPENSEGWVDEGKRITPLLPRLVPQTAFYPVANAAATLQFQKNKLMPPPSETRNKRRRILNDVCPTEIKRIKGDPDNPSITITRKSIPSSPKTRVQNVPNPPTPIVSKPTRVPHVRSLFQKPHVMQVTPSVQQINQQQATSSRIVFVSSSGTPISPHLQTVSQTSGTSSATITTTRVVSTDTSHNRQVKTIFKQPSPHAVGASQTITIPRLPKNLSSQVIVVPSTVAGKTSLVPITSLKGVKTGTPIQVTIPSGQKIGSNIIHSYSRQPNLIIVPQTTSASSSGGISLQTVKPISTNTKVSPTPKFVTIRQIPPSELKVSNATSSSTGTPSVSMAQTITIQSAKDSPKGSFNITSGGNVIEIQGSGEALQRLISKGKLSQDIIDLVQKAVSMAGQQKSNVTTTVQSASSQPSTTSSQFVPAVTEDIKILSADSIISLDPQSETSSHRDPAPESSQEMSDDLEQTSQSS